MSEFINNSEHRVNNLKELILKLHIGLTKIKSLKNMMHVKILKTEFNPLQK